MRSGVSGIELSEKWRSVSKVRIQNKSVCRKKRRRNSVMFIALKIFGTAVGVYAGVRLAGIAIEWLREMFDSLRPNRNKKNYFDD